MNKHTSLELSRLLKENGCDLPTDYWWVMYYPYSLILPGPSWQLITAKKLTKYKEEECIYKRAYDLVWDVCIRYPLVFWGKGMIQHNQLGDKKRALDYHSSKVLGLLQQEKHQEACDYIWANTVFNPSNKT